MWFPLLNSLVGILEVRIFSRMKKVLSFKKCPGVIDIYLSRTKLPILADYPFLLTIFKYLPITC